MFDEFMDELRRRQAGEEPEDKGSRPPSDDPDGDGDRDRGDDGDDGRERGDRAGDDRHRARAGGPPPRPIRSEGGDGPGLRRQVVTILVFVVAFLVIGMLVVGVDLWTDAIWYASVGYDEVFWRRLSVQVGLFALGTIVMLVILLANFWLAGRLLPPGNGDGGTIRSFIDRLNEAAERSQQARGAPPWEQTGRRRSGRVIDVTPGDLPDPTPLGRWIIAVVAVLAAITIAGSIAANWETILLWLNRVPFDPSGPGVVTDPVFGEDIGFFLFDLAFLRFLQATGITVIVATLAVAGARYLVGGLAGSPVFSTPVRVHLGVLAGLVLMLMAVGYQLDKFELVYSSRGVATGVSYTDANAQFIAYDVLTGLSAIAAAFLVGGAFTRVMWPLGLTVAVWFIASIGIGRVYPEFIQRITVIPNQQTLEAPYIANNIAMTRLAFDLDSWEVRDYRGEQPLTEAAIEEHSSTFLNARLWDYRPLGDTLDQLQTVRQYYDFADVDTDRYPFGDDVRQVMVSVREFNTARNPAPSWINDHLFYTHGIGVAMVPVNEVSSQGQPQLVIKDMPPVSSSGAPELSEPRVYFGELDSQYVVVGSQTAEFDYPRGTQESGGDVKTTWRGTTGIRLDTVLSRLLFGLRFRDLNLVISDQITNESQLLFHRSLRDRLRLVAPFLMYDKDPYVVIDDDGRLVYIQDAYTASDRFPNAQGFNPNEFDTTGLGRAAFNYLRNSVKVVMDAYDGTMTFYVNDPSDPLIRAWQGVFPTLFRPMTEFPADLRPHLRVPEEFFNVQTRMYGRYHVQNPITFYGQDDVWTVPLGQSTNTSLPSEAYYVVMSLPEEDRPEFLLLQPMIPRERPNMIAWVAARMDGEAYGQTLVYDFPADTTVLGPVQIEAQISADPVISSQFTLWSQAGSTVIRGNLIVVPVGDSLIYLQPVYLQATSAKFPAFQKIIVASPTTIVWGDTLSEALNSLLRDQEGGPGPSPAPTPAPGPSGSPGPSPTPGAAPTPPSGDVAALIAFANLHFELAQDALRDGDFARYGEEIELVEQALQQLEELTGGSSVPAPTAPPSSPAASPAPAP
ncbi:MAG TPA: UPF0182 family protein [Candidatus Limnocylindrales bacterium]|nr:UPF0182 family protein [Candidatus Limnocylindrales bacterium]